MSDLDFAQISWKDNLTPESEQFGDVYFSVDDGLAESQFVFVSGCGLPDRFSGVSNFCVAETGFGTGLNFLLTWKAWREADAKCTLDFISVEKFPLNPEHLKQAYAPFPELREYVEALATQYPPKKAGVHRLLFEGGKVRLTLMFGEAAEMYAQCEASVDAWYLDGFAPAKNPEMWREELFREIGRLSKKSAIISTFTAAGFVKRGLRDVGFDMTKRKGFGRKRESLIGSFVASPEELPESQPWFARPKFSGKLQKIGIIGAGIAGVLSANRLQVDGYQLTLFEREAEAGTQGSGNRFGLVKPRLYLEDTPDGRFNALSYLYALRFYDQLAAAGLDVWKGERGLFQIPKDQNEAERLHKIMEREILPREYMHTVSADVGTELTGVSVDQEGIYYPQSGYVPPHALCKELSKNIDVRYGVEVADLVRRDGEWFILSADGKEYGPFDAIVVANAGEANRLLPECELPMGGRKGQVSYVRQTEQTAKLKRALSYGGYMLPLIEGDDGQSCHIVGSTFERWMDFSDKGYQDVSNKGHEENQAKLVRYFPDLATDYQQRLIGGRANIRAMTGDHLPIVGPVFSSETYRGQYERLKHGKRAGEFENAQYLEGLFVITGLGARGVQTAPLLTEILAAYIANGAMPVDRDVREALHPGRFMIRNLRKGKV